MQVIHIDRVFSTSMPFTKGNKLGTAGGRSKANHTKEAEALRAYWVKQYVKNKAAIVRAAIEKAIGGDIAAIKEANERAMGKVAQEVQNTGKDGKELPTPILINMNVHADHSNPKDSEAQQAY
jgi:hypothetical protein